MAAKLLDGQDSNGNAMRRRLPVISGTPHFTVFSVYSFPERERGI
jgi:hypothetical protein